MFIVAVSFIHLPNSLQTRTSTPFLGRTTTRRDATSSQELVEKETTQSEVLHMECKETGEFAHRETTKYEQLETFNEEVSVRECVSE